MEGKEGKKWKERKGMYLPEKLRRAEEQVMKRMTEKMREEKDSLFEKCRKAVDLLHLLD